MAACTFHPIQAVTAQGGSRHELTKEASEIGVGNIVFCQVQRSQALYGHIVWSIEQDYHAQERKYWIGNIEGRRNGWCYREHIYGILVEVQTEWEGRTFIRPFPKKTCTRRCKPWSMITVGASRHCSSARRIGTHQSEGCNSCNSRGEATRSCQVLGDTPLRLLPA